MQVTQQMIDTFGEAWQAEDKKGTHVPGARRQAGLAAALKDVPDVVPFTFAGYPDDQAFLHQCGTVAYSNPAQEDWQQIQAGECDCENTSPWMRIYVERSEGR